MDIANRIISRIDFSDIKSLKRFVRLERNLLGQNSLYVPETDSSTLKRVKGRSAFFTGMEHILFGSTAEKVVRKAPCPVLTLRDPSKGFNYKEHME